MEQALEAVLGLSRNLPQKPSLGECQMPPEEDHIARRQTCQEGSRGETEHLCNSEAATQVVRKESAVLSHVIYGLIFDQRAFGE